MINLNGEEYFYIRNIQGDIIGLIDETGSEVVSYTYDTWGKVLSITGSLASTVGEKNPYLYRGYRYDSETGLYYLQSRYYNPEWGRFLNADNFGGDTGSLLSHNVFAYCMNNPVNLSDPSGHWIQVVIVGLYVVMWAITIYTIYKSCENVYKAYQEGGTSAAINQAGQEFLNISGKRNKLPLNLKNPKKLVNDINTVGANNLLDRPKSDFNHIKDVKQIEKRFGLEKNSYHPSGANGIKQDILAQVRLMNPNKMKTVGDNPDLSFAKDGQIMIVSTRYKGKSFVTELFIHNFK